MKKSVIDLTVEVKVFKKEQLLNLLLNNNIIIKNSRTIDRFTIRFDVNYIDYKGLDFDGDKIIDGWLEIWDLTSAPNERGMFIYTSKSINPGPTLSTSIQIQ